MALRLVNLQGTPFDDRKQPSICGIDREKSRILEHKLDKLERPFHIRKGFAGALGAKYRRRENWQFLILLLNFKPKALSALCSPLRRV